MKELIKKFNKYEIKIRQAIKAQHQGNYHSIFKGSGLEYEDVRSYQYGDDVRSIDWNVTAKGHGTYVKTFREEKEQNVFFIVDVSASQEIGELDRQKIDIGKEVCAVLTISAVKESANVGLIGFSDEKEIYIRPEKGLQHGYNIIYNLFKLQPKSIRTDLNKSLRYALNALRKKSIVIVISDFIDEDYEQNLTALAKKHDLVVIHLSDTREIDFPRLGIIPLYDKETKKTIWVNSSSKKFRERISKNFQTSKVRLEQLCRKYKSNYLWIDTKEDYLSKLIKLFRVRNKTRKLT
jgi:uncharacterized protein (DUF58 family)